MIRFLKFIVFISAIAFISNIVDPNLNIDLPMPNTPISQSNYTQNIVNIPSNISWFLKTSPKYGKYYNANKKFIIYFTGANCPYLIAFNNALSSAFRSRELLNYYNAMSIPASRTENYTSVKELNNNTDFYNLCQSFCIVNPNKNQIFYLSNTGKDKTESIHQTLISLKDW